MNSYDHISMVVLAGGKSRRMGTDKADLLYHEKTFLEIQIEKGRTLGIKDIMVSGYRGEYCSAPVIKDDIPEKGPLGGMETCLRRAENEYVLVLSVDVPLIPVTELQRMIEQVDETGAKATILAHSGREESMIGIYHKSLSEEMRNEVMNRNGSVFGFLNRIGYERYETAQDDSFFRNVNDPDAYQEMKADADDNNKKSVKEKKQETGALIIASTPGKNEKILFPALYEVNHSSLIKWEISRLRRAGVSPIYVLCGYEQERLRTHLVHNGVQFIEDSDYLRRDLNQSIAYGLNQVQEKCKRLLILPAEYPFFSMDTLSVLLQCEESTIPTYENVQGYPILYVDGRFDSYGRGVRIKVEDSGVSRSLNSEEGENYLRDYVNRSKEEKQLKVKTKVMLSKENDFFGPGIYHLLKNIEKTGSIQAAVSMMDMSYSKGWKMIRKVEEEMAFPFVKRTSGGKSGGGASLTEEGKQFLDRYEKLLKDVEYISNRFFDAYFYEY